MTAIVYAEHCACFVCDDCPTHRPITCNACLPEMMQAMQGGTEDGEKCRAEHPKKPGVICVRGWHGWPGAGAHLAILNGRPESWISSTPAFEVPLCRVVIGRACGRGKGNSFVFTCDTPRPCPTEGHEQIMADAEARRAANASG